MADPNFKLEALGGKQRDEVDVQHPEYMAMAPLWKKCRDVLAGEEAVKKAGREYLPMLDASPQDVRQGLYDYEAYKNRAMFFDATSRVHQGLIGSLFAKNPNYDLGEVNPNTDKTRVTAEFLDSLTPEYQPSPDYMPFTGFLRTVASETLAVGRIGILVDLGENNKPYLSTYTAEDIINWRITRAGDIANSKLVLVVLREMHEAPEQMYTHNMVEHYRVLSLEYSEELDVATNGGRTIAYMSRLYRKMKNEGKESYTVVEEHMPTRMGEPLDRIPFFFVNSDGAGPDVVKPPLMGLVNINISHYQSSADLEHGRHFTGLPTLFVKGISDKNIRIRIGSQEALMAQDEGADAKYLEFTGQGLKALETAMHTKEALMAILGIRMLEGTKTFPESAETQRVRRTGEKTVVMAAGNAISEAATAAVRVADWWNTTSFDNWDSSDIRIEVQAEKALFEADAKLLDSLQKYYMTGLVSRENIYYILDNMNLMPPTMDFEKELDQIERAGYSSEGEGMVKRPDEDGEDGDM